MASSSNSPQRIPRLSRTTDALTSAQRWQAVVKRDATIDSFVYAVLTTKIYCRPSCSARLARRANIRFYDTPPEAEKAGFRPCKRCRPQSGQTAAQNNPQTAMVYRACEQIREELAAGLKPRLQDLAVRAGLTPSHFHRVFKKHTGVTPGQYASGLVESAMRPSSDSLTPDTLFELGTPPAPYGSIEGSGDEGLNLDTGGRQFAPLASLSATEREGCTLSSISKDPDESGWNEFDFLLAAEGRTSPNPLFIDPHMLSA
ncbi:Ada DNA repair metal-binding [Penicillium argentinense]|uniref:Ada DNA repair metal-binding n=1 Tax=Penicillium argentinense TaxID=1131581 RepID=A0A9W9KB82_9EURO|nr:Ada DNA repair metal-binding [Penicillium argentinense]KAJ5099763.1 Ada DNA repair metal-binding [Penicillium argentinense]